MSKVVFFYTKNEVVSGAFLMFFELANELAQESSYDVYFVHSGHAELMTKYKNTKIKFLDYIVFDNYEELEGATFIVALNYLMFLLPKIKKLSDSKLLLIAWHPFIMDYFLNQFLNHKLLRTDIINLFSSTNSLAFMDEANKLELEEENLFNDLYIPVPYTKPNVNYISKCELVDKERINVGWLGRLDSDKINTILNLIDNLYTSNYRIHLHIIGDGDCRNRIKLSGYSPKIIFTFTSYLMGDDLTSYIGENIDLLVAPGQSALVGASIQIPVVIPVMENRRFYSNQYVYLFNCKNYSLGWKNKTLKKLGYKSDTIDALIEQTIQPGNKEKLGQQCFDYWKYNHTLLQSVNCLKNALEKTTLTVKQCYECDAFTRHIKQFEFYRYICKKEYLKYIALVPKINRLRRLSFFEKMKKAIRYTYNMAKKLVKAVLRKGDNVIAFIKKRTDYYKNQKKYNKKIEVVKEIFEQEGSLKVAFLVIFDSVFPTRPIFEEMLQLDRYEPYIIVIPDISRGREYMLQNLQQAFKALEETYGERVICGYDSKCDEYLELGNEYRLIFFSNPYRNMVSYYHSIDYFENKDILTLYSDYGFPAVKYARRVYKTDFYNKVWKVFTDSKINYKELVKYQPIHGSNSYITGYLKMDKLAYATIEPRERKRVLICPHHTVMGWNALDISNFQKYKEFFIELPRMFPEIDFVFRPHPLLFVNLINKHIWTKSELQDYMDRLLTNKNMTYDKEGDYFELFANSDAMIHDCGSYIGEYLFTEKPCCYLLKSEKQIDEVYSKMGKACLNNYYIAYSKQQILDFINNVVIEGKDIMAQKRHEFSSTVLKKYYPFSSKRAIDYIEHYIRKR